MVVLSKYEAQPFNFGWIISIFIIILLNVTLFNLHNSEPKQLSDSNIVPVTSVTDY